MRRRDSGRRRKARGLMRKIKAVENRKVSWLALTLKRIS